MHWIAQHRRASASERGDRLRNASEISDKRSVMTHGERRDGRPLFFFSPVPCDA
jgi:hypothetical protein